MQTFEDLDCWKKITALRNKISSLVKAFPKEEKFRLIDQSIRASRSATANIAEGYGRYHYQENIQFCRHSRGSLYEVLDHMIVAKDEKFISEEEFKDLKIEIRQCIAVLNGYINYLSRAKAQGKEVSEPELYYQLTDND